MLARQHDAVIDLAHVLVVLGTAFVGPTAGAAQGPGHAMPSHGHAVEEFLFVLRMDFRALFDRACCTCWSGGSAAKLKFGKLLP